MIFVSPTAGSKNKVMFVPVHAHDHQLAHHSNMWPESRTHGTYLSTFLQSKKAFPAASQNAFVHALWMAAHISAKNGKVGADPIYYGIPMAPFATHGAHKWLHVHVAMDWSRDGADGSNSPVENENINEFLQKFNEKYEEVYGAEGGKCIVGESATPSDDGGKRPGIFCVFPGFRKQ